MLVFYHHRTSCCAVKSRLALNEKGLAYESRLIDLRAGDQFRPEYLKLNPNAVVPTLVHDGVPIIESTVINEYLDEAFPDPPLRPADAVGRARMRVWTKWPDEGGHDANGVIGFALSHRHLIRDTSKEAVEAHMAKIPDPKRRERQMLSIEQGLDAPNVGAAVAKLVDLMYRMDRALGDAPWLAGARYTLADTALTPYITRFSDMGMARLWTGRFPRIEDWFARIRARPSHRKTIYDEGNPEVFALLAENGAREQDRLDSLIDTAFRARAA